MRTLTLTACVIAALFSLTFSSIAAAATEAELKQQFKQRFSQVQSLKSEGKVGETAEGYLEAVKPEFAQATREVANAENADRRELYQLIAKRTGTSAEAVAARNAARNFEKSKPGEWLKHADGAWRKK